MRVLITGGAGFTGTVLVRRLLAAGVEAVTVVDKMVYGNHLPGDNPRLRAVAGDVRDRALLEGVLPGHDAVVHLAFVSNDPQYELDPRVADEVNWRAFAPLVDLARAAGVARFVFPSSCSVFGSASASAEVDEASPPAPLTPYARMKHDCENVLLDRAGPTFCPVILRPATVCGVSPRQRLDLMVNRMVTDAYHARALRVADPGRVRPGIHVDDLADLYLLALRWPAELARGQIYNAAYENRSVLETARLVSEQVGGVAITCAEGAEGADRRSYTVSSEKLRRAGFSPRRTTADAVRELRGAFAAGRYPDAVEGTQYYNMRVEKTVDWRFAPAP